MLSLTLLLIIAIAFVAFIIARGRAVALADGQSQVLHSRPSYHGLFCLLCVLLAGFGLMAVLGIASNFYVSKQIANEISTSFPAQSAMEQESLLNMALREAGGATGINTPPEAASIIDKATALVTQRSRLLSIIILAGTLIAAIYAIKKVSLDFRARNYAEGILRSFLWFSAFVAILTTFGILFSLIGETLKFFGNIGWRVDAFLFGTTWSPLSGVQAGKLDPTQVGAVPLFAGTMLITVIAMLVAVPIGLFAAIYLSDFTTPTIRAWAKPMLEILAGIPTVVYGFFAAITVAPAIRDAGAAIGLTVTSQSALAAGTVMGIMIIPFISSLSDDVINAVPQALRDGSYGLGATKAETMRKVVLPAALPGIVSAILLGISRAIGETMIVVMAAGQGANLSLNPLDTVTTVTVQIVMLITGDTEASTAAGPAFTLGFTLFLATLILNFVALRIVRRYRNAYS